MSERTVDPWELAAYRLWSSDNPIHVRTIQSITQTRQSPCQNHQMASNVLRLIVTFIGFPCDKVPFRPAGGKSCRRGQQIKQDQLRTMGVESDDRGPRPPRAGLGLGGYSDRDGGGDSKDIHVPSNVVGLIIGKGGESIRDLQERTGARVQVAKENLPGTNDRVVTVSGSEQQIREASAAIDNIVNDRRDGDRGGGGGGLGYRRAPEDALKVPVPNDKVGLIIGKQGMTIKAIQAKTGANIQIPGEADSDDRNTRTLIVTGSEDEKKSAEEQIYQILCENEMQRGGGGGGDRRDPRDQGGGGGISLCFFLFGHVSLLPWS